MQQNGTAPEFALNLPYLIEGGQEIDPKYYQERYEKSIRTAADIYKVDAAGRTPGLPKRRSREHYDMAIQSPKATV